MIKIFLSLIQNIELFLPRLVSKFADSSDTTQPMFSFTKEGTKKLLQTLLPKNVEATNL